MAMPTKTFTPDVPQAAQRISDTQTPINDNFQAITELMGEDHINFNTNNFGRHKWVRFEALLAPGAFDPTELGVYNQVYAVYTGKNELYVHKQTAGGTVEIPFTASKMSATAPASCLNGWSYLPSGLLIRWGSKAGTPATTLSIDTAAISGGPAFTTMAVFAMISGYSNSGGTPFSCVQTGLTAPGVLNVKCSAAVQTNQGIKYLVIGV